MSVSLAIKYRPHKFDEVVEQSATKVILKQQLESGEIKNAYLFCGGAGTGKTTCARIFANEINKGKGTPIELDAASNNSVDDVREIIQQSKTVSMESDYKIFILDEVHALSNQAWQAMLKVLEEPPKKSIFIMCTTDPQKIPKTILSRVQRYNFQCISTQGIIKRLEYVRDTEIENDSQFRISPDALEYIAKTADGHLRDALTMLDKCLSYSDELTLENVMTALGATGYYTSINFLNAYQSGDWETEIEIINEVHRSGLDLKQFIKDLTGFVLDFCKWRLDVPEEYLSCPITPEIKQLFDTLDIPDDNRGNHLLSSLIKLQNNIKWDTNPKTRIEAWCITKE